MDKGMGKLISLRKLFKLSLTKRLQSNSFSNPLNRAKDRGDVLHRVDVELLVGHCKNGIFCTLGVARERILRAPDRTDVHANAVKLLVAEKSHQWHYFVCELIIDALFLENRAQATI